MRTTGYAGTTRLEIATRLRDLLSRADGGDSVRDVIGAWRHEGGRVAKTNKPDHFEADHTRFACPDGPFCADPKCEGATRVLREKEQAAFLDDLRASRIPNGTRIRTWRNMKKEKTS